MLSFGTKENQSRPIITWVPKEMNEKCNDHPFRIFFVAKFAISLVVSLCAVSSQKSTMQVAQAGLKFFYSHQGKTNSSSNRNKDVKCFQTASHLLPIYNICI